MRTLPRDAEEDPVEHAERVATYARRYLVLKHTHPGLDEMENTEISIFTELKNDTPKKKEECKFPGCSRQRKRCRKYDYKKADRKKERPRIRMKYATPWCPGHEQQMYRRGWLSPINEALSAIQKKNRRIRKENENER